MPKGVVYGSGNKYTYTIFIDNGLIYSKWGDIFSLQRGPCKRQLRSNGVIEPKMTLTAVCHTFNVIRYILVFLRDKNNVTNDKQ